MSDQIDKIAKDLAKIIPKTPKTSPYDTEAVIKRIEGDTAWVHIPGGVEETPVKLTINAKKGDVVQVRVGGGRAFLVGNATSPPTDDTKAEKVNKKADEIQIIAVEAKKTSNIAKETAEIAKANADNAYMIGSADKYVHFAYSSSPDGTDLSFTNDLLPFRGVCATTSDEAPIEPSAYMWEINPAWANQNADKYIHEFTGGMAIYSEELGSGTYAGLSALALTFYLADILQMRVGYDSSLQEYGVIAKTMLAAGNGANVKFDNTTDASVRGRFIQEIRNNGHWSIKLY